MGIKYADILQPSRKISCQRITSNKPRFKPQINSYVMFLGEYRFHAPQKLAVASLDGRMIRRLYVVLIQRRRFLPVSWQSCTAVEICQGPDLSRVVRYKYMKCN